MPLAFLLHRERPKPQGGWCEGGWRCFSEAIFNREVIIYCLKNMNRRLSAVALFFFPLLLIRWKITDAINSRPCLSVSFFCRIIINTIVFIFTLKKKGSAELENLTSIQFFSPFEPPLNQSFPFCFVLIARSVNTFLMYSIKSFHSI